jgi:hypothetical protein
MELQELMRIGSGATAFVFATEYTEKIGLPRAGAAQIGENRARVIKLHVGQVAKSLPRAQGNSVAPLHRVY